MIQYIIYLLTISTYYVMVYSSWRLAANILNKQPRTNDKGWSSSLGVGRGANNPLTVKNKFVTKSYTKPRNWTDSLDERPKRRTMDMRFGTWNVRSFYRAGSLMAVSRELSRYRLHLVGMQEVRWERSGTVPAGEYIFLYGKGNENHELGTEFFCT
jgi:hypothetical protein